MHIGADVVVTVLECQNGRVRLGFDAPRHVPIIREEAKKSTRPALPARQHG
jgi:carbon storage regulator CsrA